MGLVGRVCNGDQRGNFISLRDGLAIEFHREFETIMKSLVQAYDWLQTAIRAMPVASRWTSAGLLVLIVIGLAWTLGSDSVEDSEFLFGGRSLTESEADLVELAFSEAGLSAWARDDGRRIRVPLVNRNEYLSALSDSASLPLSLRSRVQEAIEQASPFEPREQRQARESYAKAQDLGRKISAFPEIRWASVEYDRGERPGLSRSRSQSASVFVSPEGTDPLTKFRVNIIKELVRASYADMRSDDVVVIDTNASEIDSSWEDEDPVLRKRLEEENAYEQKVQNALAGYGPIRVTAHAELDVDPTIDSGSQGNELVGGSPDFRGRVLAVATPESESLGAETREVGSRRLTLAQPQDYRVGAANQAVGLGGNTESARTRLTNVQVKRIRISVGLPASYYDQILLQDFLRENPEKAADEMPMPTDEMRQRKRIETENQIKAAVTPLLPTSVPDDDAVPLVSVWDYPDLPQPSVAESAEYTAGEGMVSWVSDSWRVLALLGLFAFAIAVPVVRLLWPLGRSGLDQNQSPTSEFSRSADQPDGIPRFEPERGATAGTPDFVADTSPATLAERSDAAEIVFSQTARQRSDSATGSRRRASATEEDSDPFQFLSQIDDEILAQRVREENPQTLAIILAAMASGKAARLLSSLGPTLRAEVMKRIAKLDVPSREVLSDIASQLRHRLLSAPNQVPGLQSQWESSEEMTPRPSFGGTRGQGILNSILAEMPETAKPRAERPTNWYEVPSGLGSISPAGSVRDSRAKVDVAPTASDPLKVGHSIGSDFEGTGVESRESRSAAAQRAHDRLLTVPVVRLREALAAVESRQAILALCGLPQSKADAVLNLLSWGQARRARKQLARIGSIELRDIDQSLELVARQLDSEETLSENSPPVSPVYASPSQASRVKLAKAA